VFVCVCVCVCVFVLCVCVCAAYPHLQYDVSISTRLAALTSDAQ